MFLKTISSLHSSKITCRKLSKDALLIGCYHLFMDMYEAAIRALLYFNGSWDNKSLT